MNEFDMAKYDSLKDRVMKLDKACSLGATWIEFLLGMPDYRTIGSIRPRLEFVLHEMQSLNPKELKDL